MKNLPLIILIIAVVIIYFSVIKPALEHKNPSYDHMTSLEKDSCELMNKRSEGILGYIYTSVQDNAQPIYRCYNGKDHMTSLDSGCEGAAGYNEENIIGYTLTGSAEGTTQLYRCYNGKDHMDSISSGCEDAAGYTNEGALGYVYTTSNIPGTQPIYRCYSGPSTTGNVGVPEQGGSTTPSQTTPTAEINNAAASCGGDVNSGILQTPIGKLKFRLQPDDTTLVFIDVYEPNIGAAKWNVIGVRKNGDTYSFINPRDGVQYLVDIKIDNCKISDTVNERADPECTIVEGIKSSTDEGLKTGIQGLDSDIVDNCPGGTYMKALYRRDITKLLDFSTKDYKLLCCSETIEMPK